MGGSISTCIEYIKLDDKDYKRFKYVFNGVLINIGIVVCLIISYYCRQLITCKTVRQSSLGKL
jgi:hypothetical protein